MSRKKVYILLIQFTDFGSRAITSMTGCRYPHASIGFEDDLNTFYSFVNKGFIVEKITRYIKPDRKPFKCQLYEFEVSETVYNALKDIIYRFVKLKNTFYYDSFGVILSMLRIPYKRNSNKYFCSGFVAEVLNQSGAVTLNKKSHKYFSKDLVKFEGMKLKYSGNLKAMMLYFGMDKTVINGGYSLTNA